ncbi:MAG: EAL domain-containing protein [Myxococcales bacterium]|nr:EAL domain-containing protein [Myxococcales bacterium]
MPQDESNATRPGTPGEPEPPAAALPWIGSVIGDVQARLKAGGCLGVLLIDLEPLCSIEAECGSAVYNEILAAIVRELAALRQSVIRAADVLCSVQPNAEELVLLLEPSRSGKTVTTTALEGVADRVWAALAPRVAELTHPYGTRGGFRLGYSVMLANSMIQTERLLHRAVNQARTLATDYSRRVLARGRERLRDLIVTGQLSTVFQPIYELSGPTLRAYEALVRGPADSDLTSPTLLFNLAQLTDLVAELDRACCESSLASAANLPDGALLFMNVMPALINDPAFRARMIDFGERNAPSRVVLELNEGVAVRSYQVLTRGIAELRAHGIRVAVDDLGAGHANLDHVQRLEPDFLKLDISLVRGVHQSAVKQTFVESLVAIGRALEATVIAEGIEEPQERDALASLNVAWGQGFLFARPEPGFLQT